MSFAFFLAFAGFIYWASTWGEGLDTFRLDGLELLLLGFATMRLGRLVAFSQVMEPFRAPFAVTVPDDSGAGESVIARGQGVRQAVGQLITCPICAGTWIAAALVYGLYAFPGPGHVFLYMTAAIGIAEVLHSLTEALCWSSSNARVQAGAHYRKNQLDH